MGWPLNEGLDHGAARLTVDVGHQHIEPNTRVSQQLMQPILLRGQHAAEFLSLAGNQAQVTDVGWRNERGTQQACPRQSGQPLGIGHVGLAPGDVLDVACIHDPRGNAHSLQSDMCCRTGALPLNGLSGKPDGSF